MKIVVHWNWVKLLTKRCVACKLPLITSNVAWLQVQSRQYKAQSNFIIIIIIINIIIIIIMSSYQRNLPLLCISLTTHIGDLDFVLLSGPLKIQWKKQLDLSRCRVGHRKVYWMLGFDMFWHVILLAEDLINETILYYLTSLTWLCHLFLSVWHFEGGCTCILQTWFYRRFSGSCIILVLLGSVVFFPRQQNLSLFAHH